MPSHKNKSNKRKSLKAKQLKIITLKNQGGGSCAPVPNLSKYYNPINLGESSAGYTNIFERTFYPRAQDVGNTPASCPSTVNQQANLELGKQSGGAYTFDFTDNIGNQPARVGYPDCCPPVYHNQEMHLSNNFAPMCGGGKKKKTKRKSHSKSKKMKSKSKRIHSKKSHSKSRKYHSKKHSGGKRSKSHSKKSYSKRSKSKSKKSHSKKSKSKKQKGGASLDGAPYQLDGVNSEFSANMMDREFGCRAPNWSPKCT